MLCKLLLCFLPLASTALAAGAGRHRSAPFRSSNTHEKRSGLLSESQTKDLQTAINVVMEQAVGIFPNKVVETVENDISSLLNPLLPPALDDLLGSIESSIASVTASLTGNLVTEFEKLEDCLTVLANSSTPLSSLPTTSSCLIGNLTSTNSNLLIGINGVLQQFVGYLPPNAVNDVISAISPILNTLPTRNITNTVSLALESYTATLSGNAVTAVELMEPCLVGLVATNGSSSALSCMKPSLDTAFVAANGVIEQLFGVMLPNLVIDFQNLLFNSTPISTSSIAPLISSFTAKLVQLSQEVPTFLEQGGGVEDCLKQAIEGTASGKHCDVTRAA